MSEFENKLNDAVKAQIKELFDTEIKLKTVYTNKHGHIFTREKLAVNSCNTRDGVTTILRTEFFKPEVKKTRVSLEDTFDAAVEAGVITRNGSWYKFGEHTLEQSREESIAEIDEQGLWDEIATSTALSDQGSDAQNQKTSGDEKGAEGINGKWSEKTNSNFQETE